VLSGAARAVCSKIRNRRSKLWRTSLCGCAPHCCRRHAILGAGPIDKQVAGFMLVSFQVCKRIHVRDEDGIDTVTRRGRPADRKKSQSKDSRASSAPKAVPLPFPSLNYEVGQLDPTPLPPSSNLLRLPSPPRSGPQQSSEPAQCVPGNSFQCLGPRPSRYQNRRSATLRTISSLFQHVLELSYRPFITVRACAHAGSVVQINERVRRQPHRLSRTASTPLSAATLACGLYRRGRSATSTHRPV
jgi:hypothetical protein